MIMTVPAMIGALVLIKKGMENTSKKIAVNILVKKVF